MCVFVYLHVKVEGGGRGVSLACRGESAKAAGVWGFVNTLGRRTRLPVAESPLQPSYFKVHSCQKHVCSEGSNVVKEGKDEHP